MKQKIKIIHQYIEAINSASADQICDLLADDHVFIDSQDNSCLGIEMMRRGWTQYFELFPDYKIEIQEIIQNKSTFCLYGHASGTYKNRVNEEKSNFWRIPAAWKAIVQDNKIKFWQVYADNSIVIDIMKRNS